MGQACAIDASIGVWKEKKSWKHLQVINQAVLSWIKNYLFVYTTSKMGLKIYIFTET